jgi:hypothetical protein
MRELIHTQDITEGKATEAIFNACRANPKREAKGGVTFRMLADGNQHEAALRNDEGVVIALAYVDQFDV